MAIGEVIQLRHSTNAAGIPETADETLTHLRAGEPAVTIATTATKLWVGLTTNANRLIISTDDADTTAAFRLLKLTGGTMTGAITYNGTPPAGAAGEHQLVNRDYVDKAVAAGQLFAGQWDPTNATEVNAINSSTTKVNGQYWTTADPGGPTAAAMHGLTAGTQFNPGDVLTWSDLPAPNGTFSRTSAGGMTQQEGDDRYLRLGAANTMTAGGVITMPTGYTPGSALQVATLGTVTSATTGMLTAVAVDADQFTGNGTSATPLKIVKISGGTY